MSFFVLIVAQLELGITPFTEDPRCKLPFTENSRTYNSMLCDLLLRILGPITLCMLSWDLHFHACYLRILGLNKLDKSDKSSNMLQVDKSSTLISFLGAYSTCCMYFFLLSMRLSLENEENKCN